jgi:DNA polymerase
MGWDTLVPPPREDLVVPTTFTPRMTNSTARPTTILGIDFETYYGQHFSLTKLSTTQYVRALTEDQVHGMSYKTEDMEKAQWLRGDELKDFLQSIDWQNTAILAHNAAFDGLILECVYGIVPAYYYDSMSMARGLHSHDLSASLNEVSKFYGLSGKVPDILAQAKGKMWDDMSNELKANMIHYCNVDVELMWNIFNKMLPRYPQDELDLINITIMAFARPLIVINRDLVYQEWIKERQKKDELMHRVADRVRVAYENIETQLSSNPQLAKMLEAYGVEAPMKPSPSNPERMTYAFAKNDIAFQNLQIHPNREVRELLEARLAVKSTIGESRAERLILHSKPTLPIMLNYCKAHTMRWTGGDKINPQNFPSGRTDSRIRESLLPPEGHKIVVIDSSQIEDRMNAWLAGQSDVLEAYRNNLDNYRIMASRIYNVPNIDDVTKPQRFVGKVARLGLGYQCGVAKFTYILRSGAMGPPVYESDLPDEDIARAHTVYRETSDAVVENWKRMASYIKRMVGGETLDIKSCTSGEVVAQIQGDKILMPNGLYLHYKGIQEHVNDDTGWSEYTYKTGKNKRGKLYGGLLTENIVQCLARIVVGEQMLHIAKRYPNIVMMTHDEVVFVVPEDEAQEAYDYGISCMRIVPDWCEGLPIDADGGFGNNYGEVK